MRALNIRGGNELAAASLLAFVLFNCYWEKFKFFITIVELLHHEKLVWALYAELWWLKWSLEKKKRLAQQLNMTKVPFKVAFSLLLLAFFSYFAAFSQQCRGRERQSDINHVIEWGRLIVFFFFPSSPWKIAFLLSLKAKEKLRENLASCYTWLAPTISALLKLNDTFIPPHELPFLFPTRLPSIAFYLCSLKHIIVKFMFSFSTLIIVNRKHRATWTCCLLVVSLFFVFFFGNKRNFSYFCDIERQWWAVKVSLVVESVERAFFVIVKFSSLFWPTPPERLATPPHPFFAIVDILISSWRSDCLSNAILPRINSNNLSGKRKKLEIYRCSRRLSRLIAKYLSRNR